MVSLYYALARSSRFSLLRSPSRIWTTLETKHRSLTDVNNPKPMNNSRCFSSTPSILFEKHQEKTRLKEDFRVESKRDSQENEGKSKVKTDQIRSSKKSYSETESKDEDYTRVHEALGKGVTIQ